MGRKGKLILLTGDRGSGKTTLLQRLIADCHFNKIDFAGLLSPAVFENGEKIAIDLLEVGSGIRRRLAETRKLNSSGIMTDHWVFDSQTIEWGNRILASLPQCGLFVLDELGPIELERGQGLIEGIAAVNRGNFRQAIVVVRPELIEDALQRWPQAEVIPVTSISMSEDSNFFCSIKTQFDH